jgi:hypothetical protein
MSLQPFNVFGLAQSASDFNCLLASPAFGNNLAGCWKMTESEVTQNFCQSFWLFITILLTALCSVLSESNTK